MNSRLTKLVLQRQNTCLYKPSSNPLSHSRPTIPFSHCGNIIMDTGAACDHGGDQKFLTIK